MQDHEKCKHRKPSGPGGGQGSKQDGEGARVGEQCVCLESTIITGWAICLKFDVINMAEAEAGVTTGLTCTESVISLLPLPSSSVGALQGETEAHAENRR